MSEAHRAAPDRSASAAHADEWRGPGGIEAQTLTAPGVMMTANAQNPTTGWPFGERRLGVVFT